MSKKTDLIHAGHIKDQFGSVTNPVYRTSTFIFKNVEQGARRFSGKEKGYIYTRLGNPTLTALQDKLAKIEGGQACQVAASGMGAISAVMWTFLKKGDRLISDHTLYGCTYALFMHSLTRFGVDLVLTDLSKPENLKKYLNKNTVMVYFETPTNPNMKVNDIKEIAKITHKYNKKIKVVVDNTFPSPYCQTPLKQGADIVVHSCTKYINGHADVIAGAVIGKKEDIDQIAAVGIKDCTGAVMDPGVAFLVNRGLSTLGVRMEQHCKNAQEIAEYLSKSKYVKKVNYPGLPGTKNHEIAKKQMSLFGGMLSFETALTFEQTKKFVDSLKVFTLAVSLGGFESLIEHPASMTHSTYLEADLKKAGIPPCLVRVSVGLEDTKDLIADLEQAFVKATKK